MQTEGTVFLIRRFRAAHFHPNLTKPEIARTASVRPWLGTKHEHSMRLKVRWIMGAAARDVDLLERAELLDAYLIALGFKASNDYVIDFEDKGFEDICTLFLANMQALAVELDVDDVEGAAVMNLSMVEALKL